MNEKRARRERKEEPNVTRKTKENVQRTTALVAVMRSPDIHHRYCDSLWSAAYRTCSSSAVVTATGEKCIQYSELGHMGDHKNAGGRRISAR